MGDRDGGIGRFGSVRFGSVATLHMYNGGVINGLFMYFQIGHNAVIFTPARSEAKRSTSIRAINFVLSPSRCHAVDWLAGHPPTWVFNPVSSSRSGQRPSVRTPAYGLSRRRTVPLSLSLSPLISSK